MRPTEDEIRSHLSRMAFDGVLRDNSEDMYYLLHDCRCYLEALAQDGDSEALMLLDRIRPVLRRIEVKP